MVESIGKERKSIWKRKWQDTKLQTKRNTNPYVKTKPYDPGIGLSMNPFAIKAVNITGMLVPTKIPVKTKRSLFSIEYEKLILLLV